MFKCNANGETELGDEKTRTLNGWLQYDRLHNKNLQIDNPVVEKVLEKFNNEDWMKVYSLLRQVYWRFYQAEVDFLNAVEENLDQFESLEQLINSLTPTA